MRRPEPATRRLGAGCWSEPEELKALRGLGPAPVVAALTTADGRLLHIAGAARDRSLLIGPFLAAAGQS